MESILIIGLCLVLITSCGFLCLESLQKKQVRVKGHDGKWYEIRLNVWFHWVVKKNRPYAYWFWTAFYFFGMTYGFVVLAEVLKNG